MRAPYGTHKSAILEICGKQEGATMAEISRHINRSANVTTAVMVPLIKNGLIHKAGIRMWYRYFTNPAAAAEFEKRAPELLAQHRKKQREIELERQRAYYHAHKEKFHAKDRERYRAKKKAKPEPAPKRVEIVLPRHARSVTDKLQASPQATVTWPDSVKVQRLPCGRDTRFTFDPPKGWKGQITQDWMDRRLAGVCA